MKNPKKQNEEMVTKSPEKVLSTRNAELESSKVIKRHGSDTSLSPREQSPVADAKPVSDSSLHEKATDEPTVSEQPRDDHHKRTVDALAAAKERFLARKRAKV